MKVLSLFDGISCARVALERAGIEVEEYYASEVDKYAKAISFKNWPDRIDIGDVKDVSLYNSGPVTITTSNAALIFNKARLYMEKEGIDLLIGGSPCQDLSIAKKDRKGLDGEKSSLFWDYVCVLNTKKPKYFILENVNSMPKEAKELITKTLGVEPIMIDASLVSAQNRKRLFWVGKRVDFYNTDGSFSHYEYEQLHIDLPEDRGILLKDILVDGYTESNKSHPIDANYAKGINRGTQGGTPSWEKGKRQIVFLDEKYFLSKQTLESTHNWKGAQAGRIRGVDGKSVTLQAGGGGTGAKTGLYAVPYEHETGAIIERVRKLTPTECERLQGLPDGYTEGISDTQRYKCLGNAFNVDVVAHILSFISKDNA